MERKRAGSVSLTSILILGLIMLSLAAGLRDTRGKEFVLSFMDNRIRANDTSPKLFVTTSKTSVVYVEVTCPKWNYPKWNDPYLQENFTVTAGQVKQVDVGNKLRMRMTKLSTRGILVNATDEVSVYGIAASQYSTDGFLALPTDAIGTKYYAVTSFPLSFVAQFLIVGTEESTRVNILLSNNTNAQDIVLNAKTYSPGDTITLLMNRYDTFQVQSLGDLTGSLVTSDRPISFFSGNKHSYSGGLVDYNNGHLVEQLIPVETWGSRFAMISTPTATSEDYIKIVTSGCDTHVLYSCSNGDNTSTNTSQVVLESAVDAPQISIGPDMFCYLESNKPVLIIQYASNIHLSDPARDPTMTLIPAIQQYSSNYTFVTPRRHWGETFNNYFVFVTNSQEVEGIRLDGKNLVSPIYSDIPHTHLAAGYFEIDDGIHTIQQTSSNSVFYGIVYGQKSSESYGFPMGFYLPDLGVGEKYPQDRESEGYGYSGKSGKFENVEQNTTSPIVWQQYGTVSTISCAVLCFQDTTCTSYTYHKERKLCRSHDRNLCRSRNKEVSTVEEGFSQWMYM